MQFITLVLNPLAGYGHHLCETSALLDELTEALVEKETVDYQEMQGLIGKYYPDGVNEKMVMPAEAALM